MIVLLLYVFWLVWPYTMLIYIKMKNFLWKKKKLLVKNAMAQENNPVLHAMVLGTTRTQALKAQPSHVAIVAAGWTDATIVGVKGKS